MHSPQRSNHNQTPLKAACIPASGGPPSPRRMRLSSRPADTSRIQLHTTSDRSRCQRACDTARNDEADPGFPWSDVACGRSRDRTYDRRLVRPHFHTHYGCYLQQQPTNQTLSFDKSITRDRDYGLCQMFRWRYPLGKVTRLPPISGLTDLLFRSQQSFDPFDIVAHRLGHRVQTGHPFH